MELYFAPLACSMATRISLYEAGAEARFTEVDLKTKRILTGGDFLAVNPMGQVPALRIETGEVLTENAVVLQYVADRHPAARLAPEGGIDWDKGLPVLAALCVEDEDLQDDGWWATQIGSGAWSYGELSELKSVLLAINSTTPGAYVPKD